MNVLFSITSSSKCRARQHSWGKENTARQSNSTTYTKAQLWSIHWSVLVTDYTGGRLPSIQPSAGSVCDPGVLPDSPRTNRLPNSSHPAVWLVTQAVLRLEKSLRCLPLPGLRIASGEYSEIADFPLGKGGMHNSPSSPGMWSSTYGSLHESICRRRGQC